jgi:hypothetical protein
MKFKKIIFVFILCLLPFCYACNLVKSSKKVKDYEKLEEIREKENDIYYMEGKNTHIDRQSEDTKKMMKKTLKKSKKYNKSKKESFFKRIFGGT